MSNTVTSSSKSAANGNLGSVQANIARVAKYGDKTRKTRDWSIYLFFRILKESEVQATRDLLEQILSNNPSHELTDSDLSAVCDGAPDAPETANDAPNGGGASDEPHKKPASEFLDWLALISGTEAKGRQSSSQPADPAMIAGLISAAQKATGQSAPGIAAVLESVKKLLSQPDGPEKLVQQLLPIILSHLDQPDRLAMLMDQLAQLGARLAGNPRFSIILFGLLTEVFEFLFRSPAEAVKLLSTLGRSPAEIGSKMVAGGLPAVCLYELLRHSATAAVERAAAPNGAKPARESAIRDEEHQEELQESDSAKPVDSLPINLAFTHSGLKALQLNKATLDSFPDVFKQGMAARAERLGDIGPSAPEHWEGELGQSSIHGYISGGFQAENHDHRVEEKYWKRLRQDVRDFNGRMGSRGKLLRRLFRVLFRLMGMEILHIELGQTPYRVGGSLEDLRLEHFGFSDGISQPFVDMNLGKPPAGGGAVRRNRTWSPVARGEIFLGHPDEDNNVHMQPFNDVLRNNGTFLVFRKLQQDVVGFRQFLKNQRPDSDQQQKKLAAELMGRWQNGTPLVVSPDTPLALTDDNDPRLNNFLFAKDDPHGRKCPLASHVRRSNPRDIGGHGSTKRHRILRRSMAYGGPLLEEDSAGDGEEKGLLFIAVNSRIDLQFEVIQGNWINKGEFLGQAGLGRCPVTGANNGEVTDGFIEANGIAPVTKIPRFVTTRGGDYFFVPSFDAIRAIAEGCKFPPDEAEAKRADTSVGGRPTPELFDEDRIRGFVGAILKYGKRSMRVQLPEMPDGGLHPREETYHEDGRTSGDLVFIGRHNDVRQVLMDNGPDDFRYSVAHYRVAGRRTSRGPDLLIGTEMGEQTGETRKRLQRILNRAWEHLAQNADAKSRIDCIAEDRLERALQRVSGSGRIDLVRDFATETAYGISSEVFGIPGPPWLTELAAAIQFNKQHIGQLQPDWLGTLNAERPENPALTTLHLWSVIFLADLVGNLPLLDDLKSLARTAGSEFMTHIDDLISAARRRQPPKEDVKTLLEAFVCLEDEFVGKEVGYDERAYYDDVIALLLELSGTIMSVVPTAWGRLVETMLDNRIDLPNLVPLLKSIQIPGEPLSGIQRLIYELDRVNPAFKIFLRYCENDHTIDSHLTINQGEWVGAMAIAANLDESAFEQPTTFSLAPYLPGPERPAGNYLLFGAVDSEHGRSCWGRERLALSLLSKFVEKTSRLQGLRKLAGPNGKPRDLAKIIVGLTAGFSEVSDRPEPAPTKPGQTPYKGGVAR